MSLRQLIGLAAGTLLMIMGGSVAAAMVLAVAPPESPGSSQIRASALDVAIMLPLVVGGQGPTQKPEAADDSYETLMDVQLTVAAEFGVLANDSDSDGDPLEAVLVENVTSGTLTLNADGSFDYSPMSGFEGMDRFSYRATNGVSSSSEATVTIRVTTAVNDAPTALDDSYQSNEDRPLVVNADNGVLANDTDPDMDPLQAILVTGVSNGVLKLNTDGSFEYTPTMGFSGPDMFTYHAFDAAINLSNTATVTIDVLPVNSAPQIVSGTRVFEKVVIDDDVEQVHAAETADLDGDGDYDVVATDYVKGMLVLLVNDGGNEFTREILDPDLEGAYPAHVADVDQDGDTDVLAGGYLGDTFAWYQNDGRGSFIRRDIDTNTDGAHSIVVVDLDQDGDNDFLTSSQDANTIAWYENDGTLNFELHVIDTTATDAKRAEAADMDNDGDLDIVSASWKADEIAWFENDGKETFTKFVIDNKANGAYYVSLADIDSDGDNDIFSASRIDHTFAWYRNDGGKVFVKQVIDTKAGGARTILAIDFDRDGDMDALGASREDDVFAWYENDGNEKFRERIIDDKAPGAYNMSPVDVDFDGDTDLFTASRGSGDVSLHLQVRSHTAAVAKGKTLIIDSTLLRTIDADDDPAELTYSLTNLPDFGEIQLEGTAVPLGGSFTQADVDDGRVTYVHGGTNDARDQFTFTVVDGGEDGVRPAKGLFIINRKALSAAAGD